MEARLREVAEHYPDFPQKEAFLKIALAMPGAEEAIIQEFGRACAIQPFLH